MRSGVPRYWVSDSNPYTFASRMYATRPNSATPYPVLSVFRSLHTKNPSIPPSGKIRLARCT